MSDSRQVAAPESGHPPLHAENQDRLVTVRFQHPLPPGERENLDSEILALLGFEPVPRQRSVEGGWTPELQREFIRRLAVHGSATRTCDEMGKNQTGVMKLYRSPLGKSFRKAWDGAVELASQRKAEAAATEFVSPGTMPPTIDHRRKHHGAAAGHEGQVVNEYGEYEDEQSYRERGEEAKDSIAGKLLRIRRLYLREISASPGKRAAFEILTELPIDWEIAARGEPQPDEPWRRTSARNPDMVLLAESGWSFGEHGYGVDKKAEIRAAIDSHRQDQGLEPVNWSGEDEE